MLECTITEWLSVRRPIYETCYSGQNYTAEVEAFEHDVFFDCELGDMMASGMCNALGITVILLTSLRHQPTIVFSPEVVVHGAFNFVNIYLAYNAYGKGHYDSLSYVGSSKDHKAFCRCGVNSKVESTLSCTHEDKGIKIS